MKPLKNWDNKTWLSSKKYINQFHKFLKKKVILKKNTRVLDIGCGRANIISFLQKKYKFETKAVGIDILRNKNTRKNILFKKSDAIKYLKKGNKFDIIIIKQTIHFFSKTKIISLLNLAKKNLNTKGTLLIFSLKTKNNKIPCFKKMKKQLSYSLKKDEILFKIIKKNLKGIKEVNFNFNVRISKKKYVSMIKNRYMSCLLNLSKKELNKGIDEINFNFKNQLNFTDTLKCLSFRK
jgi:ubiquinone/menaquinone biosynthesis C-methylase UbiE